ncbi:MAG: hypothetical protein AB7P14_18705 [Blastocatellales bacterium]
MMKNNLKVYIDSNTTAVQVVAQVIQCRVENPNRKVEVLTESPDWQQARAAFAAGASDCRLEEST